MEGQETESLPASAGLDSQGSPPPRHPTGVASASWLCWSLTWSRRVGNAASQPLPQSF